MARPVTLLTLDGGSVLHNPVNMAEEIVLKHTDSELVKATQSDAGGWVCQRRDELGVNFWEDGAYNSPETAIATLADRQAFGFRLNGEPMNPLTSIDSHGPVETIELEGLGLGGVVIEDGKQLPFGVYTVMEDYYRAFVSDEISENEKPPGSAAILERREGPGGDWTQLCQCEPTDAGCLVEAIAEDTEMEATTGNADEIKKIIDGKLKLFKASRSSEDEELRESMGIQNNTAFPPPVPKPRPIDFPA